MKRVCRGPCGLKRQLKFFKGALGRVCATCKRKAARANARKRHLGITYGITQEEYARLLAAQGGRCVCGGARAYNLAVDHDHALAGKGVRASIRGLLCKRCNKVLRDVRDSTSVLQGLIEYLQDPPARAVLASLRESR